MTRDLIARVGRLEGRRSPAAVDRQHVTDEINAFIEWTRAQPPGPVVGAGAMKSLRDQLLGNSMGGVSIVDA